jgi:hypothetical protein
VDRDESYLLILQAAASFQKQIAMVLEGQALASQKSRDWLCNHVSSSAYTTHKTQAKQANEVHEQLLEAIGGITKMEAALGKYLEVLIGQKEESGGMGGMGSMGGMGFSGLFGGMDGSKDEEA